ncbi:MAG: hypothetical protein ACLVEJ_07725 [Parabacteroides sp.]
MNKIYTLLLMALALSLLVFWTSKEKREKEPFCIIYHVAVHTLSARKLIITYTNTNGLVQETFTGKKWEKKVCLSPDEIASLRIDEITDPGKRISVLFTRTRRITGPNGPRLCHKNPFLYGSNMKRKQYSMLDTTICKYHC